MKSEPLKTCLTISMGFLLIFMLWKQEWALWTALLSGLSAVISNPLAIQIEKLWMLLARLLSHIVPNIVMGIVYFCILLPVARLSGLFRKQDALKLKNPGNTVYENHSKVFDKSHFEQMW